MNNLTKRLETTITILRQRKTGGHPGFVREAISAIEDLHSENTSLKFEIVTLKNKLVSCEEQSKADKAVKNQTAKGMKKDSFNEYS